MFGVTLVGGVTGALLLHLTDEATFRAVVPWLLLLASLMLTFSGHIRRYLERTGLTLSGPAGLVLQFVIGVYGGYFGGAVGLIMVAAWVLISNRTPKELAPARTLFVTGANTAACVLFSGPGPDLVDPRLRRSPWASVLGGFVGGRIGLRLPAIWVRGVVLTTTYVTTAVFFLRS
jgi:uncharacterized membrane protein YfcA